MFVFKGLFMVAVVSLILSANFMAYYQSEILSDFPFYQSNRQMHVAQVNAADQDVSEALEAVAKATWKHIEVLTGITG